MSGTAVSRVHVSMSSGLHVKAAAQRVKSPKESRLCECSDAPAWYPSDAMMVRRYSRLEGMPPKTVPFERLAHLGDGISPAAAMHHELPQERVVEGRHICARLHPGVHPHTCHMTPHISDSRVWIALEHCLVADELIPIVGDTDRAKQYLKSPRIMQLTIFNTSTE